MFEFHVTSSRKIKKLNVVFEDSDNEDNDTVVHNKDDLKTVFKQEAKQCKTKNIEDIILTPKTPKKTSAVPDVDKRPPKIDENLFNLDF